MEWVTNLEWTKYSCIPSPHPLPAPFSHPKGTDLRGTNFGFPCWFFFLFLEPSNASNAFQQCSVCKKFFLGVVFSYARMQARTHTALEVLAVQQCPGSAELDSIPGFVPFKK